MNISMNMNPSIKLKTNNGLSGLTNLGNTCFINSCVQVLSHTPELNALLNDKQYIRRLNKKHDSVLLIEWDNLRTILWKKDLTITPTKFVQTIQRLAQVKGADMFTGFAQNDISEFLIFVIDCFHNALAREVNMSITGTPENDVDSLAVQCFETVKAMYAKEYSEIWNMFYGIHVSKLTNIETKEMITQKPEPFFMIDLPIPSTSKTNNLLDCMNLYVEGERIDGYLNEKTNQRETVQKQLLFWSFPTILVFDLKRFNSNGRKNQSFVDFPLTNLDLSAYTVGYKKNSYVYDLYGICNHSGGVQGGHYTSFIKNANGKWYHFNDTNVTEIEENKLISPKAYCLFYRKKTV